jgi:FAD dependent oxidoreductase TIGR03364
VARLSDRRFDLAVVGAGIVGLAHALHAVRRGLTVAVIERDDRPSGASVRNFGHGFVTAQSDAALDFALSRELWLALAADAGFWAAETGTLLVARWPEELAVISEFALVRAPEGQVLARDDALSAAPISDEVIGALWTPQDVRVDAREAVPAVATWLGAERGVWFYWETTAFGAGNGSVSTSRGELEADAVVIAAGHDLDLLSPEATEAVGVRRCTLQMLRVAAPDTRPIVPALATGLALLRYRGFAGCPSLGELRERYRQERPELLEHGVNLLLTQQPDGDLLLGDTHHYAQSSDPFRLEELDDLLLCEGAALLGAERLEVRERWLGVYAHAPGGEFLVSTPEERVRAVAVTSGIGMTTALGLAEHVLEDLFDQAPTTV